MRSTYLDVAVSDGLGVQPGQASEDLHGVSCHECLRESAHLFASLVDGTTRNPLHEQR